MILDHLILPVKDLERSARFYVDVLGLVDEGPSEPFRVVRVSPDLTIQLAPWGQEGGKHLAFAMSREEFDTVFERIREAGVPFGDSFHAVGNGQGPGEETGARGPGAAVYCFDPDEHLIEIRHYESGPAE